MVILFQCSDSLVQRLNPPAAKIWTLAVRRGMAAIMEVPDPMWYGNKTESCLKGYRKLTRRIQTNLNAII